ncbi:MAG: IPT/TIG domain-containing protein [Actinomycetota bacterium]
MVKLKAQQGSINKASFAIVVLTIAAWSVAISPGLTVEGTGAIHGTETFTGITVTATQQSFCRQVDSTKYEGEGVVRLNDAVQGFTAQAKMTFEHGRAYEGPTGYFDNCTTQVPTDTVTLTKGAISGTDGPRSISCTWDTGTFKRGVGGLELKYPAGSSATPVAGQPGTCTVTSPDQGATTTNTSVEASGVSHSCENEPGGNPPTPKTCLIDWIFTKVATSGPLPEMSGLTPAIGPEAGGTAVTIIGSNFYQASAVFFGGESVKTHPCSGAGTGAAPCFTQDSNSQITAYSPAGRGTQQVSVLTPNGKSAPSAAQVFTYQPAVAAPPPAGPGGDPPGSPPGTDPPTGGPATETGLKSNLGPSTGVNSQSSVPKVQSLGGGSAGQSNSANSAPEPAPPPPPSSSNLAPPAPPSGGGTAPSFISVSAPTSVPVGAAVGVDASEPTLAPQGAHNMVGRPLDGPGGRWLAPAGFLIFIGCLLRGRRVDWSEGGAQSATPAPAFASL